MEESELAQMVSALGAIHNHGIDYEEFLAATLRLQIAGASSGSNESYRGTVRLKTGPEYIIP
eukprot:3836320-Pyramimonas_sp.AAC.2